MEISIQLDRGLPGSLAKQLADQLRAAIHGGMLAPDVPLPATRRLAQNLGLSRGVVVRAFEQLAGEGYLDAHGARGTRVAVRPDARVRSPRLEAAVARADSEPRIDLTPGRPSGVPFGEPEWRAAWRSAAGSAARTVLPPAEGIHRLRHAIARHVALARGLQVSAAQVIVTAGTSDALHLIGTALRMASEGRGRVLVEDPGYPAARRVLATAGLRVESIRVTDDGLEPAQLATLVRPPDAVLVTPSHQYPFGGHMSVQSRLALLEWAAEHQAVVLEDDYDSEFRHARMPLPSLASLPSNADVILIGSFSKTLSPALRCGYIVIGEGRIAGQVREARLALDSPVGAPLQAAIANYIESGAFGRHIARARREYAHRRSMLLDRLGGREDVHVTATDGGLHAVLRLAPHLDAGVLAQRALERGLAIVTLNRYFADHPPENGLVVGYGSVGDLELAGALDILIELFDTADAPLEEDQDRTTGVSESSMA